MAYMHILTEAQRGSEKPIVLLLWPHGLIKYVPSIDMQVVRINRAGFLL